VCARSCEMDWWRDYAAIPRGLMIRKDEPVGDERKVLSWKMHEERLIYDSRWVRLVAVDVEPPDGRRFEHHVVRLGRIAIALVVDERDRVLTLWRYRFATDQWGYELLGGIVEEGEEPAATAAREIEEESGYRPVGPAEPLISFQPLPGMVDAPVEVFLFGGAEKVGEPTDAEEAARIEWIPVDELLVKARRGELLGAGTIIPVLLYLVSREGGEQESG
jgi:8-oxo-dGTP pyrophosphatase MutT (NUDIX family)